MHPQQFFTTRDKLITGIFLVVVGTLLLVSKLDSTIIPSWLVSWPVLLIKLSLLIALIGRRNTIIWIIPLFWGVYALLQQQMPELNLKQYTPAVSVIFVGVLFLCMRYIPAFYIKKSDKSGDILNITAILSHNQNSFSVGSYQGARMVCVMGNIELKIEDDFVQDAALIETSVTMGAVKLMVPGNWIIRNNMVTLLGAVTDNRRPAANTGTAKTITLAGNVTMGALEIYSY